MKRLKAFTLVELLLVMVLSTIVIAIAYMVLAQFNLFGREFDKRTADSSEFLSFDQHLRHDIDLAINIRVNSNAFYLIKEHQELQASYTRNAAGIRRVTAKQSDNFNIGVQGIQLDSSHRRKRLWLIVGPGIEEADTFYYHLRLPATSRGNNAASLRISYP